MKKTSGDKIKMKVKGDEKKKKSEAIYSDLHQRAELYMN